jgi:hypothetical protein
MSEEEKDRLIGQTRREYREAKQALDALKKQAAKLGDRLSKVGNVLMSAPESLIFGGQSHDGRFHNTIELANIQEFDNMGLFVVTNNIRDNIVKVEKLRQDLIRLEGEDPEGGAPPGVYNSPPRPRF